MKRLYIVISFFIFLTLFCFILPARESQGNEAAQAALPGSPAADRIAETDTGDAGTVEIKEYTVKLIIDSNKANLLIDGDPVKSHTLKLTAGKHTLEVSGEGIKSKTLELDVAGDYTFFVKIDPPHSRFTHLKTVTVGSLPKGMEFTLDGKHLFISLLGIPEVVMLDAEKMDVVKRIRHQDKPYSQAGFVEICLAPSGEAVLVSQMETASVHKIPLTGENPFEIMSTISTRGSWSKVVAFSESGKLFAVSNWCSYDVSLFTYPEMAFVKKVKIPGIPRGMVFADNDTSLYVSNYSNGDLHRIDPEKGKVVETYRASKPGALRHLILDRERNLIYASDMGLECINIYDLTLKKLVRQIRVDYNPNTIALSPDKKYLYVSCRGPNASSTYLDRSPRPGRLYMIDCATWEIADIRILGNQPTALAVHPSGKIVTVSNFRDKNIEVYRVDDAWDKPLPENIGEKISSPR